MNSYECQSCQHVFSTNEAARRPVRHYEPAVVWDRSAVTMTRLGCPECGCEALNDVYMCLECREKPAVPRDDLCKGCRATEDEAELQYWLDNEDGPDKWRKSA